MTISENPLAIGTNILRPSVFLDRDGTLIEERNYLSDQMESRSFLAWLKACICLCSEASGSLSLPISRALAFGYFTKAQAEAVNARLALLLLPNRVSRLPLGICPHSSSENCDCRKPRPGMIDRARADCDIDLPLSFVIGDKDTDVLLAAARGMRAVLVRTGHGSEHAAWANANGYAVCDDLKAAADWADALR